MSRKTTVRKQPLPQRQKPTGETPITGVRIPLNIKAALEDAAKADGRTLSGLMIKILSDWLKDKGRID